MLNRRHLRIKALHFLYASFQSGNYDLAKGEKEMLAGIEKVYEMYLYFLNLITEITHQAHLEIELAKVKHLPSYSDLNPNTRFIDNKITKLITENIELHKKTSHKKISWSENPEIIKKFYHQIKNEDSWKEYMNQSNSASFTEDKKIWLYIIKNLLFQYEPFQYFFDEKSILWVDDYQIVYQAMIKTIDDLKETDGAGKALLALYKDEEDDRNFVLELYRKTILKNKEHEQIIDTMTQNWEVERIAMMDILLMKMAITEAVTFSNIPIKVTLNEYIDLSKEYSSPKSKVFINGVLDKIFDLYKKEGKIKKTGRGLIE